MSLYDILAAANEEMTLTSDVGWEGVFASSGLRSASGELVTENAALTISTCFACLNVIAGDIGKVPRKLFKARPGGGKDPALDHPVYELLHTQPNPDGIPSAFWGALAANAVFWGNGYASIERSNDGTPIALWIVHPSRATPKRRENGDLYYEVLDADGQTKSVEARDMMHVPGLGPNGLAGWVVFRKAADTLGLALAQAHYASAYLANGTAPSGILETDKVLNDPARKNLKKSWAEQWSGAGKAGSTPVLEMGLKWKKVSVDPASAQLSESQQQGVSDICRFFRVSPQKVFDTTRAQGWSTLDAQQTDHVGDALMPWFVRIEEACNLRLLTDRERADGYYVKNVVQALLRGDLKTRGTWYRMMYITSAITPNEIRELEDMNPGTPALDKYWAQLSVAPAEDIASGKAGKGATASAPPRAAPADSAAAVAAALRPVFEETSRRFLRIEGNQIGRHAPKLANRSTFTKALAAFYAKHEPNMAEAFAGLVGSDAEKEAFRDLVSGFVTVGSRAYRGCKDAAEIEHCAATRLEALPRVWAAWLLALRDACRPAALDQPKEATDAGHE